jgi:hypothetical protein
MYLRSRYRTPKTTLSQYTGTRFNVDSAMSAEDPTDKPHENAAPFEREPVPDLPRKLPTGSSGIEPAVATGFCGLMLTPAPGLLRAMQAGTSSRRSPHFFRGGRRDSYHNQCCVVLPRMDQAPAHITIKMSTCTLAFFLPAAGVDFDYDRATHPAGSAGRRGPLSNAQV